MFYELGEVRPPKSSDFAYVISLALDNEGWKRQNNKKTMQVYSRCTPDTDIKMIKVVALFSNVSAETMYDVLHDPIYRTTWDHVMLNTYEAYRVCLNSSIDYYAIKSPLAFKNRDFVMQRSWTHDDNGYIIFNRSKLPPKPNFIRALTTVTVYYIVPLSPTSCQFIYVTQSNPRGKISDWVINFISTNFVSGVIKDLHKAALKYSEWKSRNQPTWKPWINTDQLDSKLPSYDQDDILDKPDFSLKRVSEPQPNATLIPKNQIENDVSDDDKLNGNGKPSTKI